MLPFTLLMSLCQLVSGIFLVSFQLGISVLSIVSQNLIGRLGIHTNYFFLAVGEWLLILPRHASSTAGVAQPLKHIARASSSPMLLNIVP